MKLLSKFIFYRLMGWSIINNFPTETKKYVIIMAPHNTWLDFPIGVFVKSITQVKANFVGKASLFKFPFGFVFKAFGGIPVHRGGKNNFVDQMIQEFNKRNQFALMLSPEGTRKKVDEWKTGFYFIAKGAGVPVLPVILDYRNKEIVISNLYFLKDDINTDLDNLKRIYDQQLD